MVEIENEELEENNISEPTEAEETTPTPMEVTKEVVDFQKKKEEIKQSNDNPVKKEHVKKEPVKKELDLTHFNAFKDKIVKDFGLECRIDSAGHHCLYYKEFLVLKLLPRKNWWYGVCREVPEQDNIWKAFRVYNEEDQKTHYEHIKEFVKINSGE